jgi:glucose-1-phosphate thymidylyltransferase
MKVVILAAGYAVRLQPLTLKTPKPLLSVGSRKIIDRILDKVARLDEKVDAIYVVSNAKFFQKFEEWHTGSPLKNKISLINDGTTTNETRLGAIKDLELVIKEKEVADDLLVVAGDNIFDFELKDFMRSAATKADGVSVALYDIKSLELAKHFGVVKINARNRIVDFEEKPAQPSSTLTSTGIYYFPKERLGFIGRYVKMQNKLDAPGHYIGWLSEVDKVYGFVFQEDWCDIGTIESYKRADEEYSERERKGYV